MPQPVATEAAPSITTKIVVDQPRDTLPLALNDPARSAAPITAPAGPTPVTTTPTTSLPGGSTASGATTPPAATPDPAKPTPAAAPTADPNRPAPRATLLGDAPLPAAKPADEAPTTPPVVDPNAPKYDLKLSERSLLTADDLKAIENYGRTHKLAPEVAQAQVVREEAVAKAIQERTTAEARKSLAKMYDDFEAKAAADPDLQGGKLAQVKALANRALNVTPTIKKLLLSSPFGSDPAVLKDLAALGKLLQEDVTISGTPAPGTDLRTPAQRWFGTA